uniref:Uncharacterized protein n=1 Tax=Anguilla anguilla TaxID=7936 RepID=A0A0E9QQ34_ANGAN
MQKVVIINYSIQIVVHAVFLIIIRLDKAPLLRQSIWQIQVKN